MHTFSPREDVDRRPAARCRSRSCTCTRSSTATLPWATIDMDFMNLNQAAHGDREAGFIAHAAAPRAQGRRRPLAATPRCRTGSARGRAPRAAWHDLQGAQVRALRRQHARGRRHRGRQGRGARSRFGFAVNGYGVGDLVGGRRRDVRTRTVDELCARVRRRVHGRAGAAQGRRRGTTSLRDGARIELGLRAFLEDGGFKAFTTTFEDLHGLRAAAGPGGAAPDGRRLRLRRARATGRRRRWCAR